MSPRTNVHQLESDFADAMARLYAVGNGLARLRAELDREAATATPPVVTPTAQRPVAAAPPGTVAGAVGSTPPPRMPGTAPREPARQ